MAQRAAEPSRSSTRQRCKTYALLHPSRVPPSDGLTASAAPWCAPTKAERRAIIDAVRAGNEFVGAAPRRCGAASVGRVSTVDRRYALWTQDNRRAARIGGCVVGDGYIVLRLQPNGRWRIRAQGSGTAPCSVTGVRIARDLLPGLPCG